MAKNIFIGILIAIIAFLSALLVLRPRTTAAPGSSLSVTDTTSDVPLIPVVDHSTDAVSSATVPTVPAVSAVPATPAASGAPAVPATSTASATPSSVPASSDPNLVTKPEWGVSFEKPDGWKVTENADGSVSVSENASPKNVMTLSYLSGSSVTDTDAKFGSVSYFYDALGQKWMKNAQDESTGEPYTAEAVPDSLAADGMPVFLGTGRWKTYIVALSHTTFLKMNIGGDGNSRPLGDLLGTVRVL